MASFIVVYDACVLYPASLRDLLMRLARANLFHAKWTDEILDEVFDNLLAKRPDLDPARLVVTRQRMCDAVADSLVTGYQGLVRALDLPDPEADEFVLHVIDLAPNVVVEIVKRQAADLKNPPRAVGDVLERLDQVGLRGSVAELRKRL